MPRALSKSRPRLGAHLVELRKEAGLSQADLAELVGVTQQTVAFWEQSARPPGSPALAKLAKALGVRIEILLSPDAPRERKGGPAGKVRRAFETVSRLPKRQQQRILEVVEALIDKTGRNGH